MAKDKSTSSSTRRGSFGRQRVARAQRPSPRYDGRTELLALSVVEANRGII